MCLILCFDLYAGDEYFSFLLQGQNESLYKIINIKNTLKTDVR